MGSEMCIRDSAEALTTYGIIGIKVWIFKGEVIRKKEKNGKGVLNAGT